MYNLTGSLAGLVDCKSELYEQIFAGNHERLAYFVGVKTGLIEEEPRQRGKEDRLSTEKRKPGNQPGSTRVAPEKKKVRFSSRLPADVLHYLRGNGEKLAVVLRKAVEEYRIKRGE